MSILDDITDKAALARELYPHGILVGGDVLQVAGIGPEPGKSARVFLENGIVHDFNGSESHDLFTVAKHRWGLDDKDAAALLRVKGYLPQPPSGVEVARPERCAPKRQSSKATTGRETQCTPFSTAPTSPEDMTLNDFYSLEAYVPALGPDEAGPTPVEAFAEPRHGRDGQNSPLRWPHRSREGPSGGSCTPLDDPGTPA